MLNINRITAIVVPIIIASGFFGYGFGLRQQAKKTVPPNKPSKQVELPYKTISVKVIDAVKQKQIEDFITTFYDYKQQRDVDKLVGLFTQPTSNSDINDLKFILGTDGPPNIKPLSRLFTTQGYAHATPGYYLREISIERGDIRVVADELRTFYSSGEYVGYVASTASLVFELSNANGELKISKYYHQNYDSAHKKYEGFTAY